MEAHGGANSTDTTDAEALGDARMAMPPICGVRPLDAFDTLDDPPPLEPFEPAPDSTPHLIPASAIDPWGFQDADLPIFRTAVPPEPEQPQDEPFFAPPRRKGGGALTIPLICIGVAVIACTTLLPLADDNRRLAWERQKLRQDLDHLKQQVKVNDEFLRRVADDATLAERLAQRQMRFIRQGSSVLPLRGAGKVEMSPFHLVAVPPPKPLAPYQPVGGPLATLVRNPRTQLYASGGALLLIAAGLVLGYVPRGRPLTGAG
jgi:hypothetical protein